MTDDTPTQRFPEQGDSPTERISTTEAHEDLQEEKQKSRGLMIGLIAAGALLLVAIIVLVVILLPKGNGDPLAGETSTPVPDVSDTPTPQPTASEAPSATPTPEPTEEAPPPPPPATAKVDTWKVDTPTVFCGKNGQPDQIDLYFQWSTSNGNRVYFGVDTNDASQAPFFDNLPLNGNSGANFPSGYVPFQYVCGNQSRKYTLTVVDGSGHKDSKSVTVTDVNFNN